MNYVWVFVPRAASTCRSQCHLGQNSLQNNELFEQQISIANNRLTLKCTVLTTVQLFENFIHSTTKLTLVRYLRPAVRRLINIRVIGRPFHFGSFHNNHFDTTYPSHQNNIPKTNQAPAYSIVEQRYDTQFPFLLFALVVSYSLMRRTIQQSKLPI